jgi:hypothetical protein
MEEEQLISASEFCFYHQVDLDFIYNLNDSGLLICTLIEEKIFIPVSQISRLEKLVHLHYQLEINLQGIETVEHLLKQLNAMQQEVIKLNNRLSFYED